MKRNNATPLIIVGVGIAMLLISEKFFDVCDGLFCFITGIFTGNLLDWAVGNALTIIGFVILIIGLWKLIMGKK